MPAVVNAADHLKLIHFVIHRLGLGCRLTEDDHEELAAAGAVGLVRAAQAFDPARGARFSTFAYYCVRNAVLNELHLRDRRVPAVSLDSPDAEGRDGRELAEAPARPVAFFDRDQVRHLLAVLPPRERRILRWRFGLGRRLPLTLDQIGARLGLTRERVRQLELRALKRLRAAAGAGTAGATSP